jgi:uncharacterized membrane protein YfhO
VVRTEANRPALLVLADTYLHGWRASVNGDPREIARTNHAFRGVVVDAGSSEVVFEYRSNEVPGPAADRRELARLADDSHPAPRARR